jgi:O-antigen ligase
MATQTESPDPQRTIETALGWLAIVLAFSLPLYRPWVSLATTLLILLWLFGRGIRRRATRLRGSRMTYAVLVFVALNVLSLMWTSDVGAGLAYLTKLRYLLLIPIVASAVGPRDRRIAFTVFELSAAVSVVLSIGIFAGVLSIGDAHPGDPAPTMAHLDYSLLLAFAALLVMTRVLYEEMGRRRRLLWSAAAVLMIFGLLVNIGRAGHLAFAGGLLVLLIHWSRGRSPVVTAGVAVSIVLAVALSAWFVPSFKERVRETRGQLHAVLVEHRFDNNLGGRLAAMTVAREIFREHPVLGTGVGGNIPAFRELLDTRFKEFKPAVSWYRHFHNQYAQVATELGIVGLLALGWIFWELIRVRRRNRAMDATALVLATVFAIGFLGEPYFRKQITVVMFSLIAGLVLANDLDAIEKRTSL